MIFVNHFLVICIGIGLLIAVGLMIGETFKSFWDTEEFGSDNLICIVISLFLTVFVVVVAALLVEAWIGV